MNKNNAKEYLPIVQALADGKQLQIYNTAKGWKDIEKPSFNSPPDRYRIKPREWDVYEGDAGNIFDPSTTGNPNSKKVFRVREIAEDGNTAD